MDDFIIIDLNGEKVRLKTDKIMCLKIRVNFEFTEDTSNCMRKLETVQEFLKQDEFDVDISECTLYTCGIHLNATQPHFHYHIIIEGDLKLRQLKNIKYWFKDKFLAKKGLKELFNNKYSITSEALKLDDNQPTVGTAINRFLRYPLKENRPIYDYCCFNEQILHGMCLTAAEEFRFATEQADKNRIQLEQKITKWNEIRDYLVGLGIPSTDPSEVWARISSKMSADVIPPCTTTVDKFTERYIIYKNDKKQIMAIAARRTKHLSDSFI